MSDTPKRPMDENDAIKKMLDRLRKTVIDPPAEDEAETLSDTESATATEDFLSVTDGEIELLAVEEDDPFSLPVSDEEKEELAAFATQEAEEGKAPRSDAPLTLEVQAPEEAPAQEREEVLEEAPEEEREEEIVAPVYPNAFADEDILSYEEADEEDELDENVISQFFTLVDEEEENMPVSVTLEEEQCDAAAFAPITAEEEEEELSSVSTDDFLSALAWEGELSPTADMTAEADMPEGSVAPATPDVAAPSDEEITPIPETLIEEPVEEKTKEKAEEKTTETPDPRDPISFFSPAVSRTKRPAPADVSAQTSITDREAEDLFAAKPSPSYGKPRPHYLASDEGVTPPPAYDMNLFATEENGYAVEVEVTPTAPFTPTPEEEEKPAPAEQTPVREETPVDLVDDTDYADEHDDAFLNLIGKLEPQTETQKKPQPKKESKASSFSRVSAGEQLSMDIFAAEAPAVEEEASVSADVASVEEPVAPATPVAQETASFVSEDAAQEREEDTTVEASPTPVVAEPKNSFFGEMPVDPAAPSEAAPARAPHRPLPFDAEPMLETPDEEEALILDEEPLEVELPPDDSVHPITPPPVLQKKKKEGRSFLTVLKAFFSRLAPAAGDADTLRGLYTEEAAAYNEYSSRNQIALFARKFVSEGSLCTLRILLLAFLCTFLLALENFTLLGYHPAGLLASRDVQIALHLFSMLLVAIASIPLFSRAWRSIFALRVTADLYPAILILLAIIYDLLLYLLAPASILFFGLIPALFALLVAIADHRKIKADFAAFRLLSSSGDKLACSVAKGGASAEENAAIADLREAENSRVVSMKKVGFATGFFHRVTRNCEDSYQNAVLLLAAALVSLGVALAAGIIGASFLVGFYAFALSLSLVLPAVLPLLHKIPAAILSLDAASHQTAVVGEVSALEYSDTAAMTFEDVEAFPAKNMRIQRIKLYNDSALDRVLYQVAGLFSVVGGPLDGVFRASTAELGISDDVTLLRVEKGGLLALVDGSEISVGSGEYMLDHSVHVFYDPEDERLLTGGKTSVMFAAEDGILVAKFYVRYKMDEGFEKRVEALNKRGIRTLLRSFDPNVTDELIDKISYTADHGLRVIRKTVDQRADLAAPHINSGLVTKTDSTDLLRALFACRRAVRLIRAGGIAAYVLGGIGAIGAIVCTAFSLVGALPSVLFAGYHLALALLFLLISKLSV